MLAITGEYTTSWANDLLAQYPFLFFVLSLALWFGIVIGLKKAMDILSRRIEKEHLIRHTLNVKCNPKVVDDYLQTKTVLSIDEELQEDRELVRTHYLFTDHDINAAARSPC